MNARAPLQHGFAAIAAIFLVVVLAALLWLLWPAARRLLATSRPARLGLGLSIAVGFALHLLGNLAVLVFALTFRIGRMF